MLCVLPCRGRQGPANRARERVVSNISCLPWRAVVANEKLRPLENTPASAAVGGGASKPKAAEVCLAIDRPVRGHQSAHQRITHPSPPQGGGGHQKQRSISGMIFGFPFSCLVPTVTSKPFMGLPLSVRSFSMPPAMHRSHQNVDSPRCVQRTHACSFNVSVAACSQAKHWTVSVSLVTTLLSGAAAMLKGSPPKQVR